MWLIMSLTPLAIWRRGSVKNNSGLIMLNTGRSLGEPYPSFLLVSSLVMTVFGLLSLPAAGMVSTVATGRGLD